MKKNLLRVFYYIAHNRTRNLVYGTCSKYFAYTIESQVVDLGIQASVWNPFLDKQLTLGYWKKSVMECILANLQAGENLSKLHLVKDSDLGHQLLGKAALLVLALLSLVWLIEVVPVAATTF